MARKEINLTDEIISFIIDNSLDIDQTNDMELVQFFIWDKYQIKLSKLVIRKRIKRSKL